MTFIIMAMTRSVCSFAITPKVTTTLLLQMIDANERVFVGGLPYYLTDDQCRELLASFGAIKSFDLVKDRETGNSKGCVVCPVQHVMHELQPFPRIKQCTVHIELIHSGMQGILPSSGLAYFAYCLCL